MGIKVKVFYINENTNTNEIEQYLEEGYGTLPVTAHNLLVLVKQPKSKIVTPKIK